MASSIDANILIYGADESSPFFSRANLFLKDFFSTEKVYICWDIIFAFLRISTNLNIFKHPLSPDIALENMQNLLNMDNVDILDFSAKAWKTYISLNQTLKVRGKLTTDARIAATLISNGITTIYTKDSDFRKFKELKVIEPF